MLKPSWAGGASQPSNEFLMVVEFSDFHQDSIFLLPCDL